LFLTYVFKGDKVYPYIGNLIEIKDVNEDEFSQDGSWKKHGFKGGVKIKIGNNGFLNFGFQYLFGSEKINNFTSKNSTELQLLTGLSVYF
jgi:hypothetical protein